MEDEALPVGGRDHLLSWEEAEELSNLMVFKARFLSSGFNFLLPLTQRWEIYADMCQSDFFSEGSFQFQGC